MLKVSMSHLFAYVAENHKGTGWDRSTRGETVRFSSSILGDTEDLEHCGLENEMFSHFISSGKRFSR